MDLKLIITLVIVALIGVGVCLALGYYGISPFDQFYVMVTDAVSGFNVQEAMSDPTTLITTAGAGIASASAVAVPLISKLNSAKDQVTSTASAAKSQIDSLSAEKDKILSQVDDYKTQATSLKTELEAKTKELTDYKNSVGDTSKTISSLEAQVQAVQTQNSQFIQGLMQAANGALVTNPVDGKIYSVLKVPPEIQVK